MSYEHTLKICGNGHADAHINFSGNVSSIPRTGGIYHVDHLSVFNYRTSIVYMIMKLNFLVVFLELYLVQFKTKSWCDYCVIITYQIWLKLSHCMQEMLIISNSYRLWEIGSSLSSIVFTVLFRAWSSRFVIMMLVVLVVVVVVVYSPSRSTTSATNVNHIPTMFTEQAMHIDIYDPTWKKNQSINLLSVIWHSKWTLMGAAKNFWPI